MTKLWKILLYEGVDVKAKNDDDKKPLHVAADRDQAELLKLLL